MMALRAENIDLAGLAAGGVELGAVNPFGSGYALD
jgi:hypothetical protein